MTMRAAPIALPNPSRSLNSSSSKSSESNVSAWSLSQAMRLARIVGSSGRLAGSGSVKAKAEDGPATANAAVPERNKRRLNMLCSCDFVATPHPFRNALERAVMAVTEMRLASACSAVQQSEQMTVKKCPPFIDAMTYGFLIPRVTDLRVEDGAFAWDFNLPGGAIASYSRSPIDFHDSAQVEGTPFFKEDRFIIKFNCFWTIESPPGYSLLIIHPINRHDLPFTTLTGSSIATSTRIISSTFRRAGAISISPACCRWGRRWRR